MCFLKMTNLCFHISDGDYSVIKLFFTHIGYNEILNKYFELEALLSSQDTFSEW